MASPKSPRRRSIHRTLLAALGLTVLFGPAAASGCAANFAPPSELGELRVLSVSIDKPYIAPIPAADCAADPEKCTIHFDAEVYDGYGVRTEGSERQINILWIGGCFDPEGDQYSLCIFPLLEIFKQASTALDDAVAQGKPPAFPPGLPLGWGKSFSMVVPDIVSARPKPSFGPHYGVGYVFFLACAGKFGLLESDASTASNFPIGCFDKDTGEQLGAESFVPGYTQIYSFEDGRVNNNPTVNAVTFDGKPMSDQPADYPKVPPCDVPDADRNLPASCSRQDAYVACTPYAIDVDVPDDVAEIDPEAKDENGKQLKEAVWVNYYADAGNFDGDIKLISTATGEIIKKRTVQWIPPTEPGPATIWAVVRDARGGSTTVVRTVNVTP
jgi:hypothetical protein